MKNFSFTISVILVLMNCLALSASAWSEQPKPTAASVSQMQIPDTATILFSVQAEGTAGPYLSPASEEAYADAILKTRAAFSEALKQKFADSICQNVYSVWSIIQRSYKTAPAGFSQSSYTMKIRANVTAWCEPRSLQQQQIMSLYKTCQSQPTAQCYTKDFLDYLNQVEPTHYFKNDL